MQLKMFMNLQMIIYKLNVTLKLKIKNLRLLLILYHLFSVINKAEKRRLIVVQHLLCLLLKCKSYFKVSLKIIYHIENGVFLILPK